MFLCSKCNQEVRFFSKLISHYRFTHGHEHGFFLTCSIEGCEKQYQNVDSYLKHVKRKHKEFYQTHFSKLREENRSADIADCLMEVHENEDELIDDAGNNVVDTEFSQIDFKKNIGIFLIQLRENYKLPAKVLPIVVNEFQSMINHHQASVSHSLNKLVGNNEFNAIQVDQFKQILNEKSEIENALSNLDSEYKINKFARFHLNFVKPIEYKPDRNHIETYQYVPIIDTLQNLLSHDDVFAYVMNNHKSTDGILRDFCDGNIYSTNQFFIDNPDALQIMLFFDEFTAVNPLGHQVKNYKIAGFYMLLGNLPPKFRSQLHCIQLVALCHSTTLKHNGFEKILDPLINDLQSLETNGITVSKHNVDHHFYGTVSVVIADNLGAHGIGGYMESFTTLRNCRFCFIDKHHMQTKHDCSNFHMRTPEMYNNQARLVQADPALASVYGIKRSSTLNKLGHFHVVGGMPSDIAHDLFEGVVCEVMTNVIKYCVVEGFFSLAELNEELASLKFSEVDKKNKPIRVNNVLRNFKVHQSASQTWCFARILPLLVGHKVPLNDLTWESFLLLRDMLFYVCAPALDPGHLLSMADVINEFHECYRTCFPDVTVKPKFHYTLHYPNMIKQFGPLLHLQTLRFEAKHNYFKELVYRSKNRKNMCKSLAERHQYYMSSYNTGGKFLSSGDCDSTGGSTVPLVLLDNEFQRLLAGVVQGDEIFLCNSVKSLGITYWKNTCIVIGLQGFLCQFSKILHCAIIHGKPFLLCQKLRTVGFERHYHAFAVENTGHCEVYKVSDVPETNPLGIYDHPNHAHRWKLVVPKYKVIV
ncbi:uncharacterized protein [Mytilus edulis]|uniref:uncharacterized protein n=1 Tax=Mytilus edulis TaxID=6550 RepID=UPI0039F0EB29